MTKYTANAICKKFSHEGSKTIFLPLSSLISVAPWAARMDDIWFQSLEQYWMADFLFNKGNACFGYVLSCQITPTSIVLTRNPGFAK